MTVDSDDFDYSAYGAAKDEIHQAGGNLKPGLDALAAMAQEQLDALAGVAKAEAFLTKAKEKLKDISERRLPEAMASLEMKTFTTTSGLVITVEAVVRAAPPKNQREKAWAWCRANGASALVKRKVIFEFGKGEDERADEMIKKSIEADGELADAFTDESSVHPSTLTAFVKTQLEKGIDIPFDVFGVYKHDVAKIELPK